MIILINDSELTMPTCSAYGCSNNSTKRKDLSWYHFPVDNPDLLGQWVRNCGRTNWTPSRYTVLCSEHFEETCFQVDMYIQLMGEDPKRQRRRKRNLIPGSIPTIFSLTPRKLSIKRSAESESLLQTLQNRLSTDQQDVPDESIPQKPSSYDKQTEVASEQRVDESTSSRVPMDASFYSQVAASPHPLLLDLEAARRRYDAEALLAGQTVHPGPHKPPPPPPQTVLPRTDVHEDIRKMAQEDVEQRVSDEVFCAYKHREVLPGCHPHPGDVVEPGSLAAIEMPRITYPADDSLPNELIQSGCLSGLQLEGIIYACQRHQLILASGDRAGFFLGDGAGVGKGRQIAGIILDNFARGRTTHIWFSISADLIVDATRDLRDIGCYINIIDGCQQLDKETKVFGLPKDFKEGVVFSTYATLVSSVQKGSLSSSKQTSRLQQLVDWCGGSQFEGCLIFDECHKAKNFVPGNDSVSTKVALAVTTIQSMLPKARVVYCSATGVTDVKNMAFMQRLGLWGDGAPFKTYVEFLDTVQRKGLGIAEMLAMEMKSAGMYVSRGLSFKDAEFMNVEVTLTDEQKKVYDMAAHIWNELRTSLTAALARTNSTNKRVWSVFWGCNQRFFKQLCLGMKVPAIVAEAKAALDTGFCVVIGLQSTGEASMEHSTTGQTNGFVSICREIFTRFVSQNFPTVVQNAMTVKEDDWCVTAKKMLLDFAKRIPFPNSPLDELIDQLGGPSSVAEMTGRRLRLVRSSESSAPRYEIRNSGASSSDLESLNVKERNLFMEGKKLVAIISDAASTGISLQADRRVANTRRRVHLTFELAWSADKVVQQLGRSHRSNQTSGPLYKLMTTDLGGERRFATSVARRLQSLGALTKGDRRAASGADLSEFNFDTVYGRAALSTMYNAICQSQVVPGVQVENASSYTFDEFNAQMQECLSVMGVLEPTTLTDLCKVKDKDVTDVGKFLNRILGLSVKKQNMIFSYFMNCIDAQIKGAKREGRYNEGLVDITAASITMVGQPTEVFKAKKSSSNPTTHVVLNLDRGLSWEKALDRLQKAGGDGDKDESSVNGFYCSRREVRDSRLYLLATLKEGSNHICKIARPNTGVSSFDEEKGDLLKKYTKLSLEDAERGWRKQYEESEHECMHGPACRALATSGRMNATCTVGKRCYELHLLCGGIVTMMSLLELTIVRYAAKFKLSKAESVLRVVRVQLDNGDRIVGIRYPQQLLPLVEEAVIEQKTVQELMMKNQLLLTQAVGGSLDLLSQRTPVRTGIDSPAAQSRIEAVSEVKPRCLARATRPPVTIKNFFKAETKSSETNSTTIVDDSQPTTTTNVVHSKPNATSKLTCFFVAKNSDDIKKEKKKKEAGEPPHVKHSTMCRPSRTKPGGGVKRSLEEVLGKLANNRQTKRTKIPEAAKTERTCPICHKQFAGTDLNSDINAHIDHCLIE